MVLKKKIIARKIGFHPKDFKHNALATDYVDIVYGARSKLGRWLKVRTTKRVNLPKGAKIQSIENNAPSVGKVTIKYKV